VDTRTKIVPGAEAAKLATAGATVVSGYFDPLLASHARRLAQLRGGQTPLLVLISTPPDPILPARARAELVASLGVVDHVSEATEDIHVQIHLESEDDAGLQKLIQHVHARQGAAS
jgi:hypothetical protein